MDQLYYVNEAVIVFGTALAAAWLFRLVRLPSIIGFLVAGMAIGPSGWGLIAHDDVGRFSEFGLVLLLFTIGLELSPEPLLRVGPRLVAVTVLQIGATMAAAMAVLRLLTPLALTPIAILGIAIALSSTAIVLKQMSDRGETNSTTGFITTGILLLQDVIVIILMLVLSLVASGPEPKWDQAILRGALGLGGLAAVTLAARRLLPFLLDQVIRYGGRELITLFAVLMACGGAGLAGLAGWSPALGACIAGLLLAETDQRHQLVAEITPFRDVFNAMFFVSLGMLANLDVFSSHVALIGGAILATILLKPVFTALAVVGLGWPLRLGLQVGIGLCTLSEFSYVLAREAHRIQLIPSGAMDVLVAYSVGTMTVGALLFPAAGPVAAWVSARLRRDVPESAALKPAGKDDGFKNHVIIVGYGFTGSNLARMLKATHVPHCVVEMNRGLVKQARQAGAPVVVGDATRMAILEHAGIDEARALVLAVNDTQATQRVVAQVGKRRPDLYVLARTAFVRDIDTLYELGAKVVIPQDFETSVEVAAHVLKQFGIPDNVVEAQIASVRSGGYGMLRGKPTDRAAHAELIKILERTATQTFYLEEYSFACGRTLAEVNVHALTGCMLIAVVRSGVPTTNPPSDFQFRRNDVLVLVGAHRLVEAAMALLERRDAPGKGPGAGG